MDKTNQEPEQKTANKLALIQITKELMPGGQPAYLAMVEYPKITDLIQTEGEPVIMLILSVMIRDFCATMNVVRNMNEEQILEAAAMLLTECGNFRLEDYAVMFFLAKKGALFKIMDRIDLQVITAIADEYFNRRRDAKISMQEQEIERQEVVAPHLAPPKEWSTPEDRRGSRDLDYKLTSLPAAISDLKQGLKNTLQNPKDQLNGKTG